MYSRFKALNSFGEEELEQLKDSKVAVVGLGATGSVIAEHLARHRVPLLLIDRDYLEENDIYSSNIYREEECRESVPKAVAAERFLSEFTDVDSRVQSLNPENIQQLENVDLIIDGTDNIETRLLIDEFSRKEGTPWIYTAAIAEEGYSMLFDEKCFNCVFKKITDQSLESCETAGILREVSTIAASLSSMKAVKYLSGKKVQEKLKTVSGESFDVEAEGCEICENEDYNKLDSDRGTVAVCGENKYQVRKKTTDSSFERIKQLGEIISENKYLTRARVDGRQITVFESDRIILEAEDRGHAEAIVSELGI